MFETLWQDVVSWCAELSPDVAFLFGLPILVAGAAFIAEGLRSRRHRRAAVAARLAARTLQP